VSQVNQYQSNKLKMKWQIFSSDQALYLHSWDNEEYVVYNSLTGDTHLLNLTAGRLLLELQQSPTDTLTLANLVAPTDQTEPGTQHKLEIEHILEELSALNLIEKYKNTVTYSPPSCK
jgi:PqqD family protein of HPr-rel-A system